MDPQLSPSPSPAAKPRVRRATPLPQPRPRPPPAPLALPEMTQENQRIYDAAYENEAWRLDRAQEFQDASDDSAKRWQRVTLAALRNDPLTPELYQGALRGDFAAGLRVRRLAIQ